MTDSSSIGITVQAAATPTYFFSFDMYPKSGEMPLTIDFYGFLTDIPNGISTNPALIGEVIKIQIFDPDNSVWRDTGVQVTTYPTPDESGRFSGQITLNEAWLLPGTYQFRAHYDGNPMKDLLGCE